MKAKKVYDETKTYPCKENTKGHIIISKKSTSFLSGYTLNQLIKKGIIVK